MTTELHIELTSNELNHVSGGMTNQEVCRLVMNVLNAIPLVNGLANTGKAIANAQNSMEGKPQLL